uniref:G/T mismatch-specific thymine DNA glycosylase n=1 Tax=Hirondellea gigas TaxID=1518452 RepID=A0A2P2I1A9_9CRUS
MEVLDNRPPAQPPSTPTPPLVQPLKAISQGGETNGKESSSPSLLPPSSPLRSSTDANVAASSHHFPNTQKTTSSENRLTQSPSSSSRSPTSARDNSPSATEHTTGSPEPKKTPSERLPSTPDPLAPTTDPLATSPTPTSKANSINNPQNNSTSSTSTLSTHLEENSNRSNESNRFAQRDFREQEPNLSREDYYRKSEQEFKDQEHYLHSSGPTSQPQNYPPHDSQQYPTYDPLSSSDPRSFHQNSPNPNHQSGIHNQPYHQQSPSRLPNNTEHSLSSSAALLRNHRNSPYMHRGSPHLPDSSQHLQHPHGSPHVNQDSSSHFHHHQNSSHLPLNPLSYSSGRSIDSPHSHGSPHRKETGGPQDGRYPPDFHSQHHRAQQQSHHSMQQSPSPHRHYTDNMQMKDSPHHPLHDSNQDQFHPHHQQQSVPPKQPQLQGGGHDGYWNIHLDALSNKLKNEGGGGGSGLGAASNSSNNSKDWYDSSSSEPLMSDRTSVKTEPEHYQGYPSNNPMPPHHAMAAPDGGAHDSSPINPQHLSSQHGPNSCHNYSPQQQQQQQQQSGGSEQSMQQQHYPNYPGHAMGGNMSPMSPGYQNNPRNQPPHQHQYHNNQYPGDPSQYGHMPMPQQQYPSQGCHIPPGMAPHGPGREGDPYSFVDEYTGPSPRPVDEVLGSQQPKRRGRKPKHIKLMENGGDPIAIAAALAAHEAKKRKKKSLDPDAEMLPTSLNSDPLIVAAAQAAHEAKKRKVKNMGPDGKVVPTIIKPRKKMDRFDGLPEEEVAKRVLPDHLGPNLDIVIISKFPFQIGINPGLFAAYKGHHYAGPGNHFLFSTPIGKCLFLSGLIPEPLTCDDDHQLLHHGIGFTNIVARTTRGSADLTRKEIKEGGQHLLSKLQQYQPRIAVFNGKGIYEIFSGKKEFSFGRQPEKIEGTHTHVWVMPSSSARCAQLPRALDKVPFYTALRKFRDFLKGTLDELKEEDIAFANIKIRNLKKDPEKMAALAGDSLLKGEAIVEDFMGSDLLRPRDMLGEDIHKELMGNDIHKSLLGGDMQKNMLGDEMHKHMLDSTDMNKEVGSDMHKDMINRENMPKTEMMGDMQGEARINSDGLNNQDMNNMDMDPMRREMMGGGSGGGEGIRRDMMGLDEGRRDMMYGNNDNMSAMLGDENIKLEMSDLCVKEELEEEEDVSKITPQSLFKLNGMSREQLESLDCPTIPIRKKRGRPKKTPDDPNTPDRPRPRAMSQQQVGASGPPGSTGPPGSMMCNGLSPPLIDDVPRKKRGRPKKLLPDGSIPPPKRPGRKPKALKEMLQQQQQVPPMGHMGSMPPIHDGSPHPMAMNHMNGIMSPQGFSPNHNNQTFSPQYGSGGQTPVMGQHSGQGMHNPQQQYMHPHSQMGGMHQGSGLTPTHPSSTSMNHNHNGPLTPGSSNPSGSHPGVHHNSHTPSGNLTPGARGPTPHQFGQSPGYSPSPVTPQHHMPPHYPNHMQQQHTSENMKHEMPQMEEDHQLGLSPPPASPVMAQPDFDPPTSMPESEPPSQPPSDTRQASQTPNHPSPAPSHMEPSQAMHSNPSTPIDHNSSYPSYPPSYQSTAPHHSPAKHVPSPSIGMGAINKGDVASKSLSGLESLVDQIPSISGDHHETSSQHSTHSSTHSVTHSNTCSNPTTPAPPPPQQPSHPPFSPGPTPYGSSSSQSYPSQSAPSQPPVSHYNSPQHPYSPHYSSPQQQTPYSPHYSSNSTNLTSTNFSVSSLANSSLTTSLSYSQSSHSTTPATSPSTTTPSTSSFSVSSLTGGSPTPAPSLYSNSSYSPAPSGPSLSHSSYPDIMGSPMLAPTPPMGSSFMGSPGLMSSPGSMASMPGSGSMGSMSSLHSQMTASSQLPYPYSQYSDAGSPHYPSPASHSSFPHYPGSAPGFHVPSPRFPYPSPYANSPYAQGYSQNAMLDRIKHSGMGMGFGSF